MTVKGNKIRELREERGLTLNELSKKAGLSISYLSEIERGSKKPSLKTIDKIAKALNVNKAQILETEQLEVSLTLGERIRLIREEKKLTISELAARVGISVSYLSEIERDTVNPSVATLRRIAEELGVSVADLMGKEHSLGYKLKKLREDMGLTQAELASQAGVSPGLIGQIEQGKVQPSLKTIEKLAEVLGTTPCYFILEQTSPEQMLNLMSPELRELLLNPNVQSLLSSICTLNEKELQFILNFIQLFKKSGVMEE
ncbi:helix-turn-helix domain-containing protein [Carboxydothermus hydrogenoformans]|uniref:Transcriptional regulator, AraC family n=1 Tax=Carboxydothermus hydrogenoformans (strain ATCC BAA-161 / DSM 6008 / Z-2901) TaxID=246194 RepID=Q3AEM6_CARHZ|nr:helix-turn-helix transcriptional regulator [Carboxydothermus hydrogenoformans]ABB15388.1 transcriptional regulator, AraC family [Carboxydothermus hydrogenoformans Z-2901]